MLSFDIFQTMVSSRENRNLLLSFSRLAFMEFDHDLKRVKIDHHYYALAVLHTWIVVVMKY